MKDWLLVPLMVVALSALSQEMQAVTVTLGESEAHGPYLADAEGRALYLFVNEDMDMAEEPMTEGVRENAAPCAGGCLNAWPPLLAERVEAGEGVDAELLYTAEVEGVMMVVYNGWPLYYFAGDQAAGDTNGQGRGGAPNIWYLVGPDGNPIMPSE